MCGSDIGEYVKHVDAMDEIRAQERLTNLAQIRADRAEARVKELEAQLERERMRLAGCGAVALANTKETAESTRKCHPDYESASKNDVERAVDEQMRLREENTKLKACIAGLEKPKTCEGCINNRMTIDGYYQQSCMACARHFADNYTTREGAK